jgi:tetratricopeptide (TPR) repeat protein
MSTQREPDHDQRKIITGRDYYEYVNGNIYYIQTPPSSGPPLQMPSLPPPPQLPPPIEHFTNRNAELTQLLHDLLPGRVTTLCGPGGIGKTALATEALWRLAAQNDLLKRFPDGIIFFTFYGQPDPNLALEHIVASFGVEPKPTPAAAALRALAGKQVLLFLDGTEEAENLSTVLKVRGTCGVLVTSRTNEDAVTEWQDIKQLELEEAKHLLQRWGGDYAAEETAVRQICELVGRLPLAVCLVGRYLSRRKQPAERYLAWLQSSPLNALDHGKRREQSVPLLLERSLEQVSPEARHALAVAGVLALSSFHRTVVAEALNIPVFEAEKSLGELVSYGLLVPTDTPDAPNRYTISHALIHTYARKRLQPDEDVLNRLAAYYTDFAREQSQQGLEGYARLDMERAHIMRVMEACKEQEHWQAVTKLVWAVGTNDDYLSLQGYWTERQIALEAGVQAAQNLGDRRDEGAFSGNLGSAYYNLGQVEYAITYYDQALAISREIGDRRNEGAWLGNLGLAYASLGQVEKAIEYYDQALTIARDIGDRQKEGIWLGNLGLAYRDLGLVEQAIEYYEQALAISREIGDRRNEGALLGNLGNAYYDLGQVEKAIEYYELALAIARDIGDRQREGIWLGNLGNAYRDLGQVEQAIEYYEHALAIAHDIGDRCGEGNRLGNLGNAYHDLGQVKQAIQYYEQALAIFREIGFRRGEGDVLHNLGLAYKENQLEQAKQYFRQALVIFEEIKSPDAEKIRKQLAELEGKSDE